MDSSPSKRRKLSPTASVAVDASNTNLRPKSSDERQSAGRASFMTPTKASLARFNPSLLSRPKSAGAEAQQESTESPTLSSPRRLNPLPLRPTSGSQFSSPTRPATQSPHRRASSLGGALSAPPRRRSRTPGSVGPAVRTVVEEREEEDNDTADSQLESELQQQAARDARGVVADRTGSHAHDGEPELPPTPEELGLKPRPEPSKGLLSSSPSRRVLRRKGAGKPSPLKQGQALAPLAQARAETPEVDIDRENLRANIFKSKGAEAGANIGPEDPEVIKNRALLEQLNSQLRALHSDVEKLEVGVLRAQDPKQRGLGTKAETDEILSILLSTNPSHDPIPEPPKPLSLSRKISLFLPFSKRPPKPAPPPTEQLPVSHRPLDLEDPLPYLQVFNPFTISSTSTLLPHSIVSGSYLEEKLLTLTSPDQLLRLGLRLVVDTATEAVNDLELIRISPWASAEIGEWTRSMCKTGDVSAIGWACGRYWDVNSIRAKVWTQCREKYPHLVAGAEETAKGGEKTKGKGKRKAGKPAPGTEDEVERKDVDALEKALSRRLLHEFLGRQSLLFSDDTVSLRVTWRIGFDWTGEVESHVTASAAFPNSWRDTDERASLEKIGDVFERLVKERGVFEAIRIVVALLFPP